MKNVLAAICVMCLLTVSYADNYKESLAKIKTFVEAEIKIESLRKQQPADWNEIKKQYELTIPIVSEIDSKFGTTYKQEIQAALADCIQGQNVKVVQQIIAKGLQHIAVLAMTEKLDLMTTSENKKEKKYAAKYITACFEGIRPTFTRRDKDFFAGKQVLESSAEQGLDQLKKTATGKPADVISARRTFEQAIMRTYALSILFEILEVEKFRATNREECDVKRMEALIFYRIIQKSIKKQNPTNDTSISAMLNGSFENMNSKTLEELLQKGMPGISLL